VEEHQGELNGIVRLTDFGLGLFVYDCIGKVPEKHVDFGIIPRTFPLRSQASQDKVSDTIQPDGSLMGEWSTEQGTSGTFLALKQDIPTEQTESANVSAAPAMVVAFEKQMRPRNVLC